MTWCIRKLASRPKHMNAVQTAREALIRERLQRLDLASQPEASSLTSRHYGPKSPSPNYQTGVAYGAGHCWQ
jgi:hypothetical protein